MKKKKIGLTLEDINDDIWLETRPRVKPKFKSSWQLTGDKLSESFIIVQIDNKHLFSNCNHAYHTNLILSKNEQINWQEAFNITVYLSYIFDTPIFVHGGHDKKIDSIFYKDYLGPAKIKGFRNFPDRSLIEQFHEDQTQIINSISSSILGDAFQRDLSQYKSPKTSKVYSLKTLSNKKLNDALFAYYEALSASSITGQIFNFWKSIEASTTEHERRAEFENFLDFNYLKIKIYQNFRNQKDYSGNLISRYKQIAKIHLREVKKNEINSSPEAYFHKLRRNSIAHADRMLLKQGLDINLSTLLKDSILLRLVARMFIERRWDKSINNHN